MGFGFASVTTPMQLIQDWKHTCQCAGLVGKAFMAFESIGWFGYFGFPESARPWQNQLLWDKSSSCSIDINQSWICGILYAIFGYQVFAESSQHSLITARRPLSVLQTAFLDSLGADVERLKGCLQPVRPACLFLGFILPPAITSQSTRC